MDTLQDIAAKRISELKSLELDRVKKTLLVSTLGFFEEKFFPYLTLLTDEKISWQAHYKNPDDPESIDVMIIFFKGGRKPWEMDIDKSRGWRYSPGQEFGHHGFEDLAVALYTNLIKLARQ